MNIILAEIGKLIRNTIECQLYFLFKFGSFHGLNRNSCYFYNYHDFVNNEASEMKVVQVILAMIHDLF